MSWEEFKGKSSEDYEDEEITFVSVKIGTSIEGTIDGKGNRKPNRFGEGDEQTYFYTGTDGLKYGVTARKNALERFDAARPGKGDRFKLDVVAATSKSTGRKYGAVTLLVDRASGEAASTATELPGGSETGGNAASFDDSPPF